MRKTKLAPASTLTLQVPTGPHLVISSSSGNRPIIISSSSVKSEYNHDIEENDAADDLDAPAALKVCLICLADDRKTFEIRGDLLQAYTDVSGVTPAARAPRRLCWQCAARVRRAASVRRAARRAHRLLDALPAGPITLRHVRSLDRQGLWDSHLVCKHFDQDSYDELVCENEVTIKMEFEDDERTPDTKEKDEFATDGVKDNSDKVGDGLLEVRKRKVQRKKLATRKQTKSKIQEEMEMLKIPIMYKPRRIRRRKSTDWMDEFFTVTTRNYEEQMADLQARTESNNYHDAAYRCPICYRGFHSKESYESHVLKHTEKYGAYECYVCKVRQKDSHALQKHITSSHKYRFQCKQCAYVTNTRSAACAHYKGHSGKVYKCPHCPSLFDEPARCATHARAQHAAAAACALCGLACATRKGVQQHQRLKHPGVDAAPPEGPYCDTCSVKFASEEAFARHLKLSARHSSGENQNKEE